MMILIDDTSEDLVRRAFRAAQDVVEISDVEIVNVDKYDDFETYDDSADNNLHGKTYDEISAMHSKKIALTGAPETHFVPPDAEIMQPSSEDDVVNWLSSLFPPKGEVTETGDNEGAPVDGT